MKGSDTTMASGLLFLSMRETYAFMTHKAISSLEVE